MAQDIVGSRMRSNAGYGQNGNAWPSSVALSESKDLSTLCATRDDPVKDLLADRGGNFQKRTVSNAPIEKAFGMKSSPNKSDERVPGSAAADVSAFMPSSDTRPTEPTKTKKLDQSTRGWESKLR